MIIEEIKEEDIEKIALMEKEISIISFGEDAILDIEFHKKKILKALDKEKSGMLVLKENNKIAGWLWMAVKCNYLTEEKYINFKSLYIDKEFRGDKYTEALVQRGIKFAEDNKAKHIVGKVNINNLPMRLIYKKFGFKPTHLTMELKMEDTNEN